VIESRQERVAVLAMLTIVVLATALTFLMPLYIEIVQGGSSFQTAICLIPYQFSVFVAAVLIVRLYAGGRRGRSPATRSSSSPSGS
jgi:hypothetical protein